MNCRRLKIFSQKWGKNPTQKGIDDKPRRSQPAIRKPNRVNMVKAIILIQDHLLKGALEDSLKQHCPFMQTTETEINPKNLFSRIRQLNPGIVFVEAGILAANQPGWGEAAARMNVELIVVGQGHGAREVVCWNAAAGPEEAVDLPTAVAKALQRLTEHAVVARLTGVIDRLQSMKTPCRIALPVRNGLEFIDSRKVHYGEAEGNYTRLFFGDGEMLFVSCMLGDLETLLGPLGFVRIHNRFIVNQRKIARYRPGDGGEVELVSGKRLPVARSRKAGFLGVVRRVFV